MQELPGDLPSYWGVRFVEFGTNDGFAHDDVRHQVTQGARITRISLQGKDCVPSDATRSAISLLKPMNQAVLRWTGVGYTDSTDHISVESNQLP